MRVDSHIPVLCLFALCGAGILYGQTLSQLSGTVTDTSEAVISGATVTARNAATGIAQTSTSSANGLYIFPFLQPGAYEISCEMTGFKKFVRSSVVLETGGAHSLDIRLELGAMTEIIQVPATTPLLESENSTVGQLIEYATVANMPIQSRRVANLMRLMGNVVYNNESQSSEAIPNFVMGGGRSQNQMWNLDGAVVQNMTLGAPLLTFNPPAETIQEFKAETSNYSAEFGRSGSGLILMTTRSGSNSWHGAAYEFLRNDKMDARTFFAPSKAPLRFNIFGGSGSGPIKHDKTFLFVNYEGSRRRDGQTFSSNIVPHPAEIGGDFSARRDLTLLDPLTRQPFAGNIIPASRLDPVGVAVAKLYPAPNLADNLTRASGANFVANVSDAISQGFVTARLDHNFNQNNRMYARFNYVISKAVSAPVFPIEFADSRAQTQENDQTIAMGSWIRNIHPNLINEVRLNYGLRSNVVRALGTGSGENGKLGIKGVDPDYFGRFNLTGYTSLGSTAQQRLQLPILTRQVSDTITWIHGKHQVKFGGEFRYSLNKDVNSPTAGGNFTFGNRATGSAVAELLLGHVTTGVSNLTKDLNSRSDYWGGFIQDDWRITAHLTLNLGLRWDMDTPRWERDNRQSGFDPYKINPVAGVPGVVTFAGLDGVSKYAHKFDKNNFGPRLGFAYRLGDKTVIRGGYGIAYNGLYFGAVPNVLAVGFGVNTQVTSPDGGFTSAMALRDGLPAVSSNEPLGPGFGAVKLGAAPTTAVDFLDPNQRSGYMQQYNVTVQRAIGASLVGEISYQANLGRALSGPNLNINEIPLINGRGPATQSQALRLYPQFNNVTWVSPDWGASSYHSMNARLEKRYANGLNLLANFTWSKFLDTVTAGGEQGGAPSGYQHAQLHLLDKSNSNSDIRKRLIASSVYELPFRRGGKWEIHNPILNAIAGGWGVSVIAEFRDGLPYGVNEQTNTSNTFSTAQRSNILRDPSLSHSSTADMLNQYFDITAFAAPGAGIFGNSARTAGFGPGSISFDGSVHKGWLLRESTRLQYRADFYNFPNHANFANPGNSRGSGDFGRITSILSGSSGRLVQMSLRLEF